MRDEPNRRVDSLRIRSTQGARTKARTGSWYFSIAVLGAEKAQNITNIVFKVLVLLCPIKLYQADSEFRSARSSMDSFFILYNNAL
jgi:hypothetical protein